MVCVCACESVRGQSWKHVLAVSRVNVRRTWGRSRYHSPYTPLLTPHGAFYSQHPLASTHHSFSLSLSLPSMVNNTLPHSRSAIAKKRRAIQSRSIINFFFMLEKKSCWKRCFCTSENRQDKRGRSQMDWVRAEYKEVKIESVNRKGLFGLGFFLLRWRDVVGGKLFFWK